MSPSTLPMISWPKLKKEISNQNWDKAIFSKCQKWVLKLLTSNSINFPHSSSFEKYIEHKYLIDQNIAPNKIKTKKTDKLPRKFTGKSKEKKEKSSRLRKV